MSSGPRVHTLVCVECAAVSNSAAERGWRGYQADELGVDETPVLAFYCPDCAVERVARPAPEQNVSRSSRWRDASKAQATMFRVALNTTLVADVELASAFDVVAAAGGSGVSVLRVGDAECIRVEFDLEAQNDGHARRLVLEALQALATATPSAPCGWILAAVDPT